MNKRELTELATRFLIPDWLLREASGYLNLFPEVAWDRCLYHPYTLSAYGWIAREDGRADFLVLELSFGFDGLELPTIGFVTSSAERSEEFSRRLEIKTHIPCQRVERIFGDRVLNKVEL